MCEESVGEAERLPLHDSMTLREEETTLSLSSSPEILGPSSRHAVWVAVIGAGMAGLTAASCLQQHHVNVVILEASGRVGGRIWTHEKDDCFLELGSQWIHGQEDNPLFELCFKHGLISEDDVGDERSGQYRTQDGKIISQETVDFVLDHFDAVKSSSPQNNSQDNSQDKLHSSVEDLLRHQLDVLLSVKNNTFDEGIIRALFQWFVLFEVIDNACSDLKNLSCRSYSEWVDCPGTRLVNFKKGYSSVIHKLLEDIPEEMLKIRHEVSKIEWEEEDKESDNSRVNISVVGKGVITVDHVIVTVSLGVLKAKTITFCPRLPAAHEQLIQSNGYGTINKIFLRFRQPFWEDRKYSLKLIWTDMERQKALPEWVVDISGFDAVRGTNDMLMAWIGGRGAEKAETIPEHDLGKTCCQLLEMFTGLSIQEPVEVLMSKWFTNPLFRGSYSHPTTTSDSLELRQLTPLISRTSTGKMIPRVFFAGEATDREFYSSTHGAFRSGMKAANEIVSFVKGG